MQDNGIVALEIDGDALAERFPALRTDDVAVAGIAGGAGYVDPTAYTACLAAAATGAGATLETETTVDVRTDPTRVVRPDGEVHEVDAVLVAAGARTKGLLADAGIPSQSSRTACRRWSRPPTSRNRCVTTRPAASTCDHAAAGLLAGDGTEDREADPDAYERDADPAFADGLLERVSYRVPSIADGDHGLERAWAGLCTATPDRDPLVGRIRDGLYVATGFQGHGFMRAPAIGERLAEEILDGGRIDAFDPTRFRGDEAFDVVEGMALDPN